MLRLFPFKKRRSDPKSDPKEGAKSFRQLMIEQESGCLIEKCQDTPRIGVTFLGEYYIITCPESRADGDPRLESLFLVHVVYLTDHPTDPNRPERWLRTRDIYGTIDEAVAALETAVYGFALDARIPKASAEAEKKGPF